ncbi:MAG: F0F1 ATP synthase subunit gamma [Candidatus Carsonella ruddii]
MNIKNIKSKINILSNINKLTNTMSMISFSKMKKISDKCNYLKKLYLESKQIFLDIYKFKKNNIYCCILITTNKGFCGNINNESIKYFLKFIKNNKKIDLIIIGKKGIDFFKKKNLLFKEKIIFNKKVFLKINFIKKILFYENIIFFSSKLFKNNIKSIKTNLFELKFNKKKIYQFKKINKINIYYIYINFILNYLYFENYLSELKNRMMIMKSAYDNSKKIIKNMIIIKNKIRQFKVTQEMLEIINTINL